MCRSVGGSITPITGWLQCADHALAPLCRSSSGSYVPVGDIELAVLARDEAAARHAAADALASVREPWEPASTARNLGLIREARAARGEGLPWADAIEAALRARAQASAPVVQT